LEHVSSQECLCAEYIIIDTKLHSEMWTELAVRLLGLEWWDSLLLRMNRQWETTGSLVGTCCPEWPWETSKKRLSEVLGESVMWGIQQSAVTDSGTLNLMLLCYESSHQPVRKPATTGGRVASHRGLRSSESES
jgi:hypothetical protein